MRLESLVSPLQDFRHHHSRQGEGFAFLDHAAQLRAASSGPGLDGAESPSIARFQGHPRSLQRQLLPGSTSSALDQEEGCLILHLA